MRFRLALIAALVSVPALAQDNPAEREQIANRIAAATEALAQYKSVDNGVWSGVGVSRINDSRPDLSRKVDMRALRFGYDHRFASPFTANDQLLLGVAGGALKASTHTDAQNIRVDSRGWSGTAYGVYAPYIFLSFPVSVTVTRWKSDQTRDGTPLMPVYSTSYNTTSFASSVGTALTLPVSRYLLTTSITHRYLDSSRPDYREAINPLATDFQVTPSGVTDASQLVGNMRLALPFQTGRIWGSAGYAYDLKRGPSEDTRSEFPLAVGFDFLSPRWQIGAGAQVILRNEIKTYTGALTGRVQF